MASLPVPMGKGVFQLIWKDWFAPPAAVQAWICGIGLPLVKAVLVTVSVAGGVLVGTALGLGGEVGLGEPLFQTPLPPPQAIKEKLLTVSVNKPRIKGVFITYLDCGVATGMFIKNQALKRKF